MIYQPKHSLEILESRIAPATAIATAPIIPAIVGGPTLLHAGEGLGTATQNAGTYLLFVEKGDALIFTTDFNNNGVVDFNEITGISAGDGLRLISFVNINGDIVTNLDSNNTLSDSDNNTANDDPFLKGDGRVVNNTTIEKIELRSLTIDDLLDQNNDGTVDQDDVTLRLALSSYSIFGTIYAGKGFGVEGDLTSGLIINDAGRIFQQDDFVGEGLDFFYNFKPSIGAIKTGTASNGEYFSFGSSRKNDTEGLLTTFVPPNLQNGGDIVNVRAATVTTLFNIDALIAGDGGVNGRGGNIKDVTLNTDTAGGYEIRAGDGGRGPAGGAGGSVINFQDVGSDTGQIIIRSGDGGVASTGAGGNGGDISLGRMNVSGGLGIILGSGGDGFTAGGNGASLTKATVTTPEGNVPFGTNMIGSTHDAPHDPVTGRLTQTGVIGRSMGIDFDQDGLGDAVFTSQDPGQLVVLFGAGGGLFKLPIDEVPGALPGQFSRIELFGTTIGDALTVADFNGDNFKDIATASNQPGSFGGIRVFLAKTEDRNQDGVLSEAEDIDGDGVIDFLGFQSPRDSPLPSLAAGDPAGGVFIAAAYSFARSAVPITDIEAGDFDGDGFTDLAVTATYTSKGDAPGMFSVVVFLTPNIEPRPNVAPGPDNARPTGHFFADVGTKATSVPPAAPNPLVPFSLLVGLPNNFAVIEATALSEAATHDVIVGQVVDPSLFANFIVTMDNSQPSAMGPVYVGSVLPQVDTNRGNDVSETDVTIKDFTIHDSDNDTIADFTGITRQPAGFMIAMQGTGIPVAPFAPAFLGDGTNQAGFFFGAPGFDVGTDQLLIRNTVDVAGGFSDVAVMDPISGRSTDGHLIIYAFEITDVAANDNGQTGATLSLAASALTLGGFILHVTTVTALDIFIPEMSAPEGVGYVGALPTLDPAFNYIESTLAGLAGPPLSQLLIADRFVKVSAGNGGDALVGSGGIGGRIGDLLMDTTRIDPVTGLPINDLVGTVSITLPNNLAYAGVATFSGGDGGNGFSFGGRGGAVSGTTVRYASSAAERHSEVSVFGGNGGFGVAGPGGAGGDLDSNSFESGRFFTAGNGGRGTIGGAGGSIKGHGREDFFDAQDPIQVLQAGHGGNGVKLGGAGGDILNFTGAFDLKITGNAADELSGATLLSHIAGNGGSAISGPGGRGGDVINSSPLTGENRIAGDVVLRAGNGGNGKFGGSGGSVRDFLNSPSESDNPAILSIIAGIGGNAASGRGGNGGNIINIDVASTGTKNPLIEAVLLTDVRIPLQPYPFNRFLAGDGGQSSGGKGGHGGIIQTINTSNSDNPFAMVSGAGGSALYKGGHGGAILDVQLNLGAENANKGLIIAGAGGSAAAFIPNKNDPTPGQGQKAFGGRIGKAGNGGSIINLTQSGSIGARLDLIAGNGGDTVNYGTVADFAKLSVGKGGSIINVVLAGNVGNIADNILLQSYNDVFGGETVQDFVTSSFRDPLIPGAFDDSLGMVGAVVGSAGRLKEAPIGVDPGGNTIFRSQPATKGINGSIVGLTARNIASAIAGAVERIASVQVVRGINITGGGVLGKNTDDPTRPGVDYEDPAGNPIPEPVPDARLVDGALVYRKFKPLFPGDSLPPGRVFQLG